MNALGMPRPGQAWNRGQMFGAVVLAFAGLTGVPETAVASGLQAPWEAGIVRLEATAAEAEAARLLFPGETTLAVPLSAETVVSGFASYQAPSREKQRARAWVLTGSTRLADGRIEMVIRQGSATEWRALEVPRRVEEPRMRTGVVPLVGAQGLAGIAWLQGAEARGFEVWASEWTGRRFARPRRVAAAARGSQVGLTAAVLTDGSWVLAWSAYDGEDDEIVVRVRQGTKWLPLVGAHPPNEVPDITPRLTATADGGALLAWSRYGEGHYRTHLARLDGASSERFVDSGLDSPPGSVYPDFRGTSEVPILVYLDAAPREWALLELEPTGTVLGRASVAAQGGSAPWVESRGQRVSVSFAGEGRPLQQKQSVAWSH